MSSLGYESNTVEFVGNVQEYLDTYSAVSGDEDGKNNGTFFGNMGGLNMLYIGIPVFLVLVLSIVCISRVKQGKKMMPSMKRREKEYFDEKCVGTLDLDDGGLGDKAEIMDWQNKFSSGHDNMYKYPTHQQPGAYPVQAYAYPAHGFQ